MTMVNSRRSFMLGLGATGVAASAAKGMPPADLDVVVVGAGAAGIAAAGRLARAGLRIVVLEARGRIGGRAWTDQSVLGLPFDMGAAWLEGDKRNPLLAIAKSQRASLTHSDFDNSWIHYAGKRAPEPEVLAFTKAEERIIARVTEQVRQGQDRSLESMIGTDPWERLVVDTMSSATIAHSPANVSIIDLAANESEGSRSIEGGYGAFLARQAHGGLDVRLGHAVQRIDHSGTSLRITTASGTLNARACIVTIPVSLLAKGSIVFDPALPTRFQKAFESMPMGQYFKTGVALHRRFDVREEYLLGGTMLRGGQPHAVHLDPRLPLATVMYGAHWGEAIARGGEPARRAFAEDVLKDVFGSEALQNARAFTHSGWDDDPWALGAYSSVAPGMGLPRSIYDEDVDGRIRFAGEAAETGLSGTVGGAWQSGQKAADALVSALT